MPTPSSRTNDLQKTWRLFTTAERRSLVLVGALTTLVALLEVMGIASVMPFLSVLANPEMIRTNEFLSMLWQGVGHPSDQDFLFWLGIGVFVMIAITNAMTAVAQWAIQHFTWMQNHSLSLRLLSRYFKQPWAFYLQRNSAEIGTNVLAEVQTFIIQFLISGLNLIAQGVAASFIVALLFAVDPVLAVLICGLVGGAYVGIFWAVRRKQAALGDARQKSNEVRFKVVNEAMGGMKDLKILQLEEAFIERFQQPSFTYSVSQARNAVMALVPRYVLEALAFGAVILILLYQLSSGSDVRDVIPVAGLYAFAGFRLLPKMQAMFYAGSTMRFTSSILERLSHDLASLVETEEPAAEPVDPLIETFGLRNVSFRYNDDAPLVLNQLDLTIQRREFVGFVGGTGSGKTTCVDLLVGLLRPSSGALVVDGHTLTPAQRVGWRRQCGYVPQQIYLVDDTITANIALGVPPDQVDMESVRRAAKIANLDVFVDGLEDGYETQVGDRGVRLSGGQRQRIGIARALYHDPEVLVFDEATSALDNLTERAIIDALEALSGHKTLIMIAHRLSTVQQCDRILLFEHGKVALEGDWDTLYASSPTFQRLVDASQAGRGVNE